MAMIPSNFKLKKFEVSTASQATMAFGNLRWYSFIKVCEASIPYTLNPAFISNSAYGIPKPNRYPKQLLLV